MDRSCQCVLSTGGNLPPASYWLVACLFNFFRLYANVSPWCVRYMFEIYDCIHTTGWGFKHMVNCRSIGLCHHLTQNVNCSLRGGSCRTFPINTQKLELCTNFLVCSKYSIGFARPRYPFRYFSKALGVSVPVYQSLCSFEEHSSNAMFINSKE